MELRAGYKQTELGVIPDCWETSRLDDLGAWKGGATPSMSNPKFWLNGDIPWASSGEVKTALLSDTTLKITEAAVKQSSTTLLPVNSVMLVTRSGILRKYLPVAKNTCPIAINQDIKAIIPGATVDAGYLLHALIYSGPRILASCLKAGTTVESVEYPWLKAFKIPLPLVPEQRAIATALSDVDALLVKIDQLIAKKRDLKQAAMQQLLTGQTRLPGFSGEWEVKPMKSLGQTYGGLAGKTKEDFGHGSSKYIPFMNVMTDTVIDPNWLETVDVGQNEAQNLAKKGDLFFNGSSETPEEVGFCSVLLEDIPSLYLNSFCFGFRFNTDAKVCGLFFAYWFRGAEGRARMSVLAQGATRYNIAKSAFMRLSIPQPLQEEQTAIATVLSDMDAELAALEARRDKTRALKQGMMQALLTGRIRLI